MSFDALRAAGVDVDDALARVMGNEALLRRLLDKFCADENCARLAAAAEKDDAEAGLAAAHALKGVSGNLSLTRVFSLTARQCELIRAGDWPAARALVPDVVAARDDVVRAWTA